jgi:hypothetical protein
MRDGKIPVIGDTKVQDLDEVSLPPHFHEGKLYESEHNRAADDKVKGSPSPVNNDPARLLFPAYLYSARIGGEDSAPAPA